MYEFQKQSAAGALQKLIKVSWKKLPPVYLHIIKIDIK